MYPVDLSANNASPRNRLTTFFRYLMAIPIAIFVAIYGLAAAIVQIIAWFALMFTGRYPPGLYDFVAGYLRANARYNAYVLLLTDAYPPFSGGEESGYPVKLTIGPPQAKYSRLLVFFRGLLLIPVLIVALFYGLGMLFAALVSWFAILFTGRQSEGLFSFLRGGLTYGSRAGAYMMLLTDKFPPV